MFSADEAGTAAILAHAIAHIALRHYTCETTRRYLQEIGMRASPLAGANNSARLASKNHNPQLHTNFEFDADRFAVKLLIDAGPAPNRRIEAVLQAINAQ
jgi:predicted Zn-dependent protease